MNATIKAESLSGRPQLRKRKVRATEHDDFEYGDLDDIIVDRDDADEPGTSNRTSNGRTTHPTNTAALTPVSQNLTAAATGPLPVMSNPVSMQAVPFLAAFSNQATAVARSASPSNVQASMRTRPTNNQLLYKAYFRWEHYPHAVEDESMLEMETEPCASVTSAFLKVRRFSSATSTRVERPSLPSPTTLRLRISHVYIICVHVHDPCTDPAGRI